MNEKHEVRMGEIRRTLLDASHEASRIRSAAWAAQTVLQTGPHHQVDHLELMDRVSNLLDLMIDRAQMLEEQLDATSDKARHLECDLEPAAGTEFVPIPALRPSRANAEGVR